MVVSTKISPETESPFLIILTGETESICNSFAETKVKSLLENIKAGKIVDFREYKLPNECDLIFLADKGVIFYPNFFGKEQKAQHGWDPRKQKTFYLIKGMKGKKEMHVVNLMQKALQLVK